MSIVQDFIYQVANEKFAAKSRKAFDSATPVFDAADFVDQNIELSAVASVQQWTETDDLEEGETKGDRLLALLIGIADEDKDGELTEDEQSVLDIAISAAYDYLVSKGVDEDDAETLLSDFGADVADRVCDLLIANLPDGDDAAGEEMDAFVFGAGDGSDEAALDAVYKKKLVVRNGKKVRINKRVAGVVRLSAAQKVAIRKARMKSHSAAAMIRRRRSLRVRKQAGL